MLKKQQENKTLNSRSDPCDFCLLNLFFVCPLISWQVVPISLKVNAKTQTSLLMTSCLCVSVVRTLQRWLLVSLSFHAKAFHTAVSCWGVVGNLPLLCVDSLCVFAVGLPKKAGWPEFAVVSFYCCSTCALLVKARLKKKLQNFLGSASSRRASCVTKVLDVIEYIWADGEGEQAQLALWLFTTVIVSSREKLKLNALLRCVCRCRSRPPLGPNPEDAKC